MQYKPVMIVLLLINAAAIAIMNADKNFARRRQWRVPERVLMAIAVFGGSPGILIGMITFRHKTQKPRFAVGVPLILIAETAAAYFLCRYYGLI